MLQTILNSLLNCLESLFQWQKSASDNQTASSVIQEGKDQKRACRYAELAIELVESKATFARNLNKHKFDRLVRKFRKWK